MLDTLPGFQHSYAVIIGINEYADNVRGRLNNAVRDARRLAEILERDHKYTVFRHMNEDAALKPLEHRFGPLLHEKIRRDDRLLIYFAGHGLAGEAIDSPTSYLIPQDAEWDNPATYLPMSWLVNQLAELPCRHLLLILDCCYAGAIRWAGMRGGAVPADLLNMAGLERFLQHPAWQVITSTAHDQPARDQGIGYGSRPEAANHSPFALALFDGLQGEADRPMRRPNGDLRGDGVITATDLYVYLRDSVEQKHRQTPGLWPLPQHDRGEYIFLVPGCTTDVPPAPPLPRENPYRGLEPYNQADSDLFFGRTKLLQELITTVTQQTLTVISGPPQVGKSSLVQAGLLKELPADKWECLPTLHPGARPLTTLASLPLPQSVSGSLTSRISLWRTQHINQDLLLVIDQLEELITCSNAYVERSAFLKQVADALDAHKDYLHVVIVLDTHYLSQFTDSILPLAEQANGFMVTPLEDDELRQVIEGPAEKYTLYFEPAGFIDDLVKDVKSSPGALPLLSLALHTLYQALLQHDSQQDAQGKARVLSAADYAQHGGIGGIVCGWADEIYKDLDQAHKATMQRILSRMVLLDGERLLHRMVPISALDYGTESQNAEVETVWRKLRDKCLIVEDTTAAGDRFIKPAHEALIQQWVDQQGWISGAKEQLRFHHRLTGAVDEWIRTNRRSGLWTHDPGLSQALDLLESNQYQLNRQEREFIYASLARRKRVQQGWIAGISAFLLVVLAAALSFAGYQQQQQEAARESQVSRAQALAVAAGDQLTRDPELGVLLAMEAVSTTLRAGETPVPQAVAQLHQSLLSSLVRQTLPGVRSAWAIWSPDGGSLLTAGDQYTVQVWNTASGKLKISLRGHTGPIHSAAWSSDGRYVLTSSEDHTARIWDVTSGQLLRTLQGHTGAVYSAAWSPDGHEILTASEDRSARIWDASQGQTRLVLPADRGRVIQAAWSPDERSIVTISDDHVGILWDTSNGQRRRTLAGWLTNAAWSPDGKTILTTNENKTVSATGESNVAVLWDALSGQALRAVPGGNAKWSPDGHSILAGMKIWDATTGNQQVTLPGQVATMRDAVWSPEGQNLAIANNDGTITICAVAGEVVRTLHGHQGTVTSASWSPNGQRLATTSIDGTAKIWEALDGQEYPSIPRPFPKHDTVFSATWSPVGLKILTVDSTFSARIWDAATGAESRVLRSDPGVATAHWSPDGRSILTEDSADGTTVWDITNGQIRTRMPGHGGTWSPDGQHLLTLDTAGTATIWDAASGEARRVLRDPRRAISQVIWSPDGANILLILNSTSQEYIAAIWDAMSGKQRTILRDVQGRIREMSWSPDGHTVLMLADTLDYSVSGWDIESGQVKITLRGQTSDIQDVEWSPDGRWIATVGDDSIQIWDSTTGQNERTLRDHDHPERVWWRPDGLQIATSTANNTVQFWDLTSGQEILTLPGHPIGALWSSDNQRVLLNEGGTLRQYASNPNALLALAQSRVTRTFSAEEESRFLKEISPK